MGSRETIIVAFNPARWCQEPKAIVLPYIGLTKLMWRCLELSYTFLSRGEGNARL